MKPLPELYFKLTQTFYLCIIAVIKMHPNPDWLTTVAYLDACSRTERHNTLTKCLNCGKKSILPIYLKAQCAIFQSDLLTSNGTKMDLYVLVQ